MKISYDSFNPLTVTPDRKEAIVPLDKLCTNKILLELNEAFYGTQTREVTMSLDDLRDSNVIPKRIPLTIYGRPIYIPLKSLVPTKIIRSNNATVVFWNDDTKTVVKRSQDTPDDPYNAFCAALGIKLYGTNSALKRAIREAGGLPDTQDREAGGLPDTVKEATP